MTPQDIKQMIQDEIKKVMSFAHPKYGDTPTDALQLTPKKYVDSKSGTPGGSNTQIQFNDGGAFGGDADLTWDKTNHILYITAASLARIQVPNVSGANAPAISIIGSSTDGAHFAGDVSMQAGSNTDAGGTGAWAILSSGRGPDADHNGRVALQSFGTTFLMDGTDTVTYASTISLDVSLSSLHLITTTNAVGNATINATGAAIRGQVIYLLITNDSTSNRTITFGTNFKSTGTLVGTTSKTASIAFIADGTNFYELFRTTGL